MAPSRQRKNVLLFSIIIVFTLIVARLFNIQIISKYYRINAENNALKYETLYPARGLILDRNGQILVSNKITYDIMVTPVEVAEFDTLEFCSIFGIDTSFVHSKFREYRKYRSRIGFQTLPFIKQVSGEHYNIFIEQQYKFPGFSGTPRTIRTYPINAGGNLYGYISEVDAAYIKNNPDYKQGDYAGRTGMEMAYEEQLRGEKGYNIYLRDAHNRIKERYEEGEYDKAAVAGKDVTSTIDAILQAYGEELMQNKVGSLVAIEPSTGEILTMVSSPGLETSKLAEINKYYQEIVTDPYKPMFNRAVMSPQPPGSVFKLVNGLIGLQEGVITPATAYSCHGAYTVGNLRVGCHGHPSPLDFRRSIMMSCNTYYCYVFRAILDNPKYEIIRDSFTKWKEYVESFGFGMKLNTDIPSEQAGTMPTAEWYDRLHGKNRWRSLSIISLAIGQGEIGSTPLHLANLAATIANRGWCYTPHLQKEMPDNPIDPRFKERHYTMVDTSWFECVVEGMYLAVNGGPGATGRLASVSGLEICGKTGTAQNPHGNDHSVFICFAPKDDPKIAVAAYIENAGFGSTWACPISALLVEKYLNGEISKERKWLETNMMNGYLLDRVTVSRR
ncbi:MAG TPA: penicillin-binding transpeptidase domain-containing protein [Bacteroidales bacterium]|jgi:penicillin-binding protein 2|nr:penicillin-binding transpeptidase domain-containing protein [Bacteroidales bacterium]HPB88699.1 penicillin-binding transpeptidase domain-containing protein [Bacteroidales bacterium]HPY22514.1 penicillin-binding transpeptidase domain-containing protein [Bacteroidales bacterium]HQA92807.1 penicillin-binding transpeptidase domain-containing protein [Bacteroidales bacterium]HQN23926.1 penicillin-binding transpeptidase domain-containing protein [Bacteroidales bacterium]